MDIYVYIKFYICFWLYWLKYGVYMWYFKWFRIFKNIRIREDVWWNGFIYVYVYDYYIEYIIWKIVFFKVFVDFSYNLFIYM